MVYNDVFVQFAKLELFWFKSFMSYDSGEYNKKQSYEVYWKLEKGFMAWSTRLWF
jgi:hypothetical protein